MIQSNKKLNPQANKKKIHRNKNNLSRAFNFSPKKLKKVLSKHKK